MAPSPSRRAGIAEDSAIEGRSLKASLTGPVVTVGGRAQCEEQSGTQRGRDAVFEARRGKPGQRALHIDHMRKSSHAADIHLAAADTCGCLRDTPGTSYEIRDLDTDDP